MKHALTCYPSYDTESVWNKNRFTTWFKIIFSQNHGKFEFWESFAPVEKGFLNQWYRLMLKSLIESSILRNNFDLIWFLKIKYLVILIENNRKSCCESTFIPNKITTTKNINVLGGCQRSTYVLTYESRWWASLWCMKKCFVLYL